MAVNDAPNLTRGQVNAAILTIAAGMLGNGGTTYVGLGHASEKIAELRVDIRAMSNAREDMANRIIRLETRAEENARRLEYLENIQRGSSNGKSK